jgi:hypothetical protein
VTGSFRLPNCDHETSDPEYVVRNYGAPSFSTVPLERPGVFAGATGFASTAHIALVVPPFDWRHVAEAQRRSCLLCHSPSSLDPGKVLLPLTTDSTALIVIGQVNSARIL